MSTKKNPKIVALANQKGGVGKTTTAINLATALAAAGFPCLLIDIDPQGNATTGLGIDYENRNITAYDVLVDDAPLDDAIQETGIDGVDILPGTTELSSIDVELVEDKSRVLRLKTVFSKADLTKYAYVLIDCPPSLSLLTVNALAVADSVLVPLQSEFFALEGLSQLLLTVRQVRSTVNADLILEGIVLTMFDTRNRLSHQVEDDVRENMNDLVYDTKIPRNVRVSEAPSFGLPAVLYDPQSAGSKAYQNLAVEFLKRNSK